MEPLLSLESCHELNTRPAGWERIRKSIKERHPFVSSIKYKQPTCYLLKLHISARQKYDGSARKLSLPQDTQEITVKQD